MNKNTNVYDPVELVKDLADKIGINQLYTIARDMQGESTTIDIDREESKREKNNHKAENNT